ncbi:MAG: hypothetical protein WD751_00870 [Anaerolineales bacterium]
MQVARDLPERQRLSAVMAVILLAYAATRFVQLPGQALAFDIAGISLPLPLNLNTITAILIAGLTATGADWLLQSYAGAADRSRYRHWFLPAMTAWVLSLLLGSLAFDLQWWLGLGLCALFLLAVLLAEYASSAPQNRYYALSTQALAVLTYCLFLILAITVRAVALRLYLALPAVALGVFTAGSRLQLLTPGQRWQPLHAIGVTFICMQLAAAFHYLPLSALGYGLGLLGLLYALNRYTVALNTGEPIRPALREAGISLAVFWVLALLLR